MNSVFQPFLENMKNQSYIWQPFSVRNFNSSYGIISSFQCYIIRIFPLMKYVFSTLALLIEAIFLVKNKTCFSSS